MIKFLSEVGPLGAFVVGYYYYGNIISATLCMLITSIVCVSICYLIEREIKKFSLIASGILFVSAVLTLISGNPMFIMIKATILYVISSSTLFISAKNNRPILKYLFSHLFQLQEQSWNILSYRFSGFCFLMAILNEVVWRNYAEEIWVQFKFLGVLPMTLIFILLQIPFLLKNKLPNSTRKDKDI